MGNGGEDLNAIYTSCTHGFHDTQHADADGLARNLGRSGAEDVLPRTCKTEDIACSGACGEGPVGPMVGIQLEQLTQEAEGLVLDVGGDGFIGKVDLDILIVGCHEIVGESCSRSGAARDEAVVVGRPAVSVQCGDNVIDEVAGCSLVAKPCLGKSVDQGAPSFVEHLCRRQNWTLG